jgi:phosphoribosylformylglycinamidine cyclo-ligase
MGVGFVVFCKRGGGQIVVDIAAACGLRSCVGGQVEPGPRQVIVEPLGLTFEESELQLRAGR